MFPQNACIFPVFLSACCFFVFFLFPAFPSATKACDRCHSIASSSYSDTGIFVIRTCFDCCFFLHSFSLCHHQKCQLYSARSFSSSRSYQPTSDRSLSGVGTNSLISTAGTLCTFPQ
uniref:Putative secreted protein n=1 Tax=Amblyomma tuberculatum TaxID=48802 RepID=A0A6M2E681_9ACAR